MEDTISFWLRTKQLLRQKQKAAQIIIGNITMETGVNKDKMNQFIIVCLSYL